MSHRLLPASYSYTWQRSQLLGRRQPRLLSSLRTNIHLIAICFVLFKSRHVNKLNQHVLSWKWFVAKQPTQCFSQRSSILLTRCGPSIILPMTNLRETISSCCHELGTYFISDAIRYSVLIITLTHYITSSYLVNNLFLYYIVLWHTTQGNNNIYINLYLSLYKKFTMRIFNHHTLCKTLFYWSTFILFASAQILLRRYFSLAW